MIKLDFLFGCLNPSPTRTFAGLHAIHHLRRGLAAALIGLPLLLGLAAPNEAYAQTSCNVSSATTEATGAFDWHRDSSNSGANLPAATVFYRTLIALGVSPLPAWTGSNISGNAPTTPITAAEARTFRGSGNWSGWNPILTALDCLEAQVTPDFGPDPVPDPTLPVGPEHMPQVVLNRDYFVVEEPQSANCSDTTVGDEQTWTPLDANNMPITDGSDPSRWKIERHYGNVLTKVGYKVTLDRSPGAGKFVSVEIWEPTDLDRGDVFRNDPETGKGRFYWNAEIHGSGWPPIRQGRITIANTTTEVLGNTPSRPLLNTYLTFTDENWNLPQTVTVNVHCAQHDVTTPLPIWHFAFRHDDNGGVEGFPPGYDTNRKGDNSPRNTSLRIAQVRVVDSTAPAAVTSDIAGGIELDPRRSLSVIKKSSGDGLVRRIGLEFNWNNPDNSHQNDYQHAREKFTGFRVTLRSLEDGTVQERFVPTFDSTSPDFFQVPFYAYFEAESIGATVDRYGFAQPTDTNDEKFEWSVVPVNWWWDDVGAERATRCVLVTYRKPNGTIPYVDTDANPTCPAAQQGESEGASTLAVSVPDTAVANVQATAVDDTSASVSWDAVAHATAYEVSWSAESSDLQTVLSGVERATGTSVTIQHNASERMTLTVTVTPEYVDENGDTQQLDDLAGTATLEIGPTNGLIDSGGGTNGGGDGGPVNAGEGDAQAMATAACVSADLMQHVEARIEIAITDRWIRIRNALIGQPNAITLTEVKDIYENRKANGWDTNRLEEVIAAMECIESALQQTPVPEATPDATPDPDPTPTTPEPDPEPEPIACVSPQLRADAKSYSEETWRESADHVERWLRVLQTFSGTANDSTVMTPTEAEEYVNRGWERWVPVLEALKCMEQQALDSN